MTERETKPTELPQRTTLKGVFSDLTSQIDTPAEHVVIGTIVGAAIIGKEVFSAGKKTARLAGRVSRNTALNLFDYTTRRR